MRLFFIVEQIDFLPRTNKGSGENSPIYWWFYINLLMYYSPETNWLNKFMNEDLHKIREIL